MRQTWRWFGPKDLVSIDDMLQAGVEGVVTALHHIPTGEIWQPAEIAQRQALLAVMSDGAPSGLAWEVVESLPVSEDIKRQTGEMRETYGVPVEEIVRGIRNGVRKVNIDTDLRLAGTAEFRRIATQQKSEFDPRKFLKPAMDAMSKVCRDRFEAFGTAGNASRIKVLPMSEMAKRYASGALDPKIAAAKAA